MTIKYQYAQLDKSIVDISSVTECDRKLRFTCLGCGRSLIPVLGDRVERHFRHKTELACSGETYLHNLAKNRFYDDYSKCLEQKNPFLIHVLQQSKCTFYEENAGEGKPCGTETPEFLDLTKWFSEPPLLESRYENFIPDVLLRSRKGVPLFVEIKVSHACSQEKIDSGHRIIEIEINSVDDIDFELGVKKDSSVSLFNFSLEKSFDCGGICDRYTVVKEYLESKKKQEEQNRIRYLEQFYRDKFYRSFVIDGRKVIAGSYHEAVEQLGEMPEIYEPDFEYLKDPELESD